MSPQHALSDCRWKTAANVLNRAQ